MNTRPAVLLSRNEAYERRASVTVAPVTRRIRNFRGEVLIGIAEGLREESAVNLDDMQTVRLSRISNRIGRLSAHKMQDVEEAIRFVLGLPRYAR
jgi:mRNA interferase MazF